MSEDRERLEQVERRLGEIKRRRRGGIRWHITERTAEIAIRAIERGKKGPVAGRPIPKRKRRQRHKRLL